MQTVELAPTSPDLSMAKQVKGKCNERSVIMAPLPLVGLTSLTSAAGGALAMAR